MCIDSSKDLKISNSEFLLILNKEFILSIECLIYREIYFRFYAILLHAPRSKSAFIPFIFSPTIIQIKEYCKGLCKSQIK